MNNLFTGDIVTGSRTVKREIAVPASTQRNTSHAWIEFAWSAFRRFPLLREEIHPVN